MGATGSLKKRVPFFDAANSDYEFDKGMPLTSFSTEAYQYFLDRYDERTFDIKSYFDILIAPYYVINKKIHSEYHYSNSLTELFFKLFPSAEEYEKPLLRELESVQKHLSSLYEESGNKSEILEQIDIVKGWHYKVFEKLSEISNADSGYKYALIGLDIAKEINILIENVLNKTFLTPTQIISHYYHFKNPSTAWKENPLAFFINGLYGGGFDETNLKREYHELEMEYDELESFEKYIGKLFRREYKISFRLIEENIKAPGPKEKKQEYILELCEHLTILFNKSVSHSISKITSEHLRPYKSLLRNLKNKFKKYSFAVNFNYEKDRDDLLIETSAFLNSLMKIQIKDIEGKNLNLFQKEFKKNHISSFIAGDLDAIPIIHFKWSPGAVYYLLMKLMKHGAAFIPAQLHKSEKLYLSNGFFKRNNYDRFKNKLKTEEKQSSNQHETIFPLIDDLFK